MRTLLTNDDGVHSPGLWSAARALKEVGEVVVVAPDRDQSGMGTAMTLLSVLRVEEITSQIEDVRAFAVQGTPADCVILGTESLVSGPIDLVVSGINQGSNLGMDVMVSGTMGAAFHGYFRGIPSIAVSVVSLSDVRYEAAARTIGALASTISETSLPGRLLINVNLPNVAPDRIEGVDITRLGSSQYLGNVQQGNDARRRHYWIRHTRMVKGDEAEGTDTWSVRNNRISITPLHVDFTPPGPESAFDALARATTSAVGGGKGNGEI